MGTKKKNGKVTAFEKRTATRTAAQSSARAGKTAVRGATARKAAAKKAAAKKAAAKKAGLRKAAVKKAAVKTAAGKPAVAKKASARQAGFSKAAATRVSAKRAFDPRDEMEKVLKSLTKAAAAGKVGAAQILVRLGYVPTGQSSSAGLLDNEAAGVLLRLVDMLLPVAEDGGTDSDSAGIEVAKDEGNL